jgi:DNA replication protein DnaC
LKYFPILIIDDFALTRVSEEYVLPRLYEVIDSRYCDGKQTIFTTNTGSRADIEAKTGKAIADRIFESCRVVNMTGESLRRKA